MSAGHTPHPVAIADPAQWLRTFALQFKGETRASLEHCAGMVADGPDMLAALTLAASALSDRGRWVSGDAQEAYLACSRAIAKASAQP